MSNKTISINPSLFSLTKTKKNKEKKNRPVVKPLISPNVLKNKLLNRIKEHKSRETSHLENNKTKLTRPTNQSSNNSTNKSNNSTRDSLSKENTYSDEFNDSISYLQTLSKQKKINDEKANYEREKERARRELERKTVKNYHSLSYGGENFNGMSTPTHSVMPIVNLDLPEELITAPSSVNIFKSNNDSVPYGVLKGGSKPTYRTWAKTQRNLTVTNPKASLIIENNVINKTNTERENRLNSLRDKLKIKQHELKESIIPSITSHVEQPIIVPNIINTQLLNTTQNPNVNQQNIQQNISLEKPMEKHTEDSNKLIKTTITRKYTLGKSKTRNNVAILIKDRGTRKKIISAQRDLKRRPINDIKTYLRDHNLIKIGSNAPNDVLRKLYETSMLAGEITNNNPETLLHNLSKDISETK